MKKQKKIISVVPKNECLLVGADCYKVGEASLSVNLREREGALQAVGACHSLGQIAADSEILALDDSGEEVRVIIEQGGAVKCAGFVHDGELVAEPQLLVSGVSLPCKAVVVGKFLVISTSEETIYMKRTAAGYDRISKDAMIPDIVITTTEQATETVVTDEYTFVQPLTTWRAPLAEADVSRFSGIVGKAMGEAIASAELDGRYCSPVVAKYGVRLWDDSYVWVSAPVVVGSSLAEQGATTIEARTASNAFTGLNAGTIRLNTFRLGLTVLSGTDALCDDLIKSIDVWVGRAKFFELNRTVDYQCLTSAQGSTRRYVFQFRPRTVNAGKVANDLACCSKWQLVASTSDLAALRAGVFKSTNLLASTQPLIASRATMAMRFALSAPLTLNAQEQARVTRQVGTAIVAKQVSAHLGALLCAGIRLRHENGWRLSNLFDETVSQGTSTVSIDVTISTSDGERHICDYATLPFVPQKVLPVVAFHDDRAVAMKIMVQSGSLVRQCTMPLFRSAECGMAYFAETNLSAQTLASAPALTAIKLGFTEQSQWALSLSVTANPFVQAEDATVSSGEVLAVASALRPLYSGGYGRYPLYLFAADGVYALPRLASGRFGVPHLILRETLKAGTMPTEAGEAVCFITKRGTVHRLVGGNASVLIEEVEPMHLAWNKTFGELWVLLADGTIRVIERSGRGYRRTMQAKRLLANDAMPLAQTEQGEVLSLVQEEVGQEVAVEWLSHPVQMNEVVANASSAIVWNSFGDNINAELKIYGENGVSCHGFLVNSLAVRGNVNYPLESVVLAPALRHVRAHIRGVVMSNFKFFSVKMMRMKLKSQKK